MQKNHRKSDDVHPFRNFDFFFFAVLFLLLLFQFNSMIRLFYHCWTIRDDTAKESACIPKSNPVHQFSCVHAECISFSFLITFSCFASFVSLCFSYNRLVNMQLVLFKGSMNLVDHCRRFCWFLRCLHTNASHCERPNENKNVNIQVF